MKKPSVVADIMKEKVVTLNPDSDVYEAIDCLIEHRISGAPVVDDGYRLVGMMSEIDCIQQLAEGVYEGIPSATVGECMTTEVTTLEEDTPLLTVADLFLYHGFRRLPVVRGGLLVGQVSRRELLGALSEVLRATSEREAVSPLYLSALDDGDANGLPEELRTH